MRYHGYSIETPKCNEHEIVAEALYRGPQGDWRIVAFPSRIYPGETVYDTLIEEWPGAWRRIRMMTRGEEHRYPKRAARAGHELVKAINRNKRQYEAA